MVLSFRHNFKTLFIEKCTSTELKQIKNLATAKEWVYQAKKYNTKGGLYKTEIMFKDNLIPAGLWYNILKLRKSGWNVKITNLNEFIRTMPSMSEYIDYIETLNLKFTPYEYQIEASYKLLKYPSSRIEIAPGGGKTLTCYIAANYLLDKILPKGKKVLVIVPRVILVTQTAKSFETSYTDHPRLVCDTVFSGGKKYNESNVVIGNTSTLVNYEDEYFEQFGAVLIDESHTCKTNTVQDILAKMPDNIFSINGCTGTSPEKPIETLISDSYLGPIVFIKTQRELIDIDKSICDLKVNIIHMKVPKERSKWYYLSEEAQDETERYRFETQNIWKVKGTKELVLKGVRKYQKNHLFAFSSIALVNEFAEYFRVNCPDRTIHIIHGGVSQGDRDDILDDVENNHNRILCATYPTIDTGVDLHRINYLHCIEGTKSFYRLRQYFGRGSRLHNTKKLLLVFDYNIHLTKDRSWDDITKGKSPKINIYGKQFKERIKIYEKHKYKYEHYYIDI